MKRDLDYLREILLKCEADESGQLSCDDFADEYHSEDCAAYHCQLLLDEHFIEVIPIEDLSSMYSRCIVRRITSQGHNYLDSVRNDSIWVKTKEKLKEVGDSLPLSLILKVAEALIAQKLSL